MEQERERDTRLRLLSVMGSSGGWMLCTLCVCFGALETGEWTTAEVREVALHSVDAAAASTWRLFSSRSSFSLV